MTTTTKNNAMGPNKLTAFNRVKLLAMHDAGVRKSVIARDLDVDPMTVAYHINRQKELITKYSTDDAPTSESPPPIPLTLKPKPVIVNPYASLAASVVKNIFTPKSLASPFISSLLSQTSLLSAKKHKSPAAGLPAIVTALLSAVAQTSSTAP